VVSPEQVARDLLRIGAVALRPDQPFTWASGRLAPVYTDNRLTLSHPDIRDRLAEGFRALAGRVERVEAIAGTATAGIPHAALLADRLGLPMCYVRSAAKGHGKGNRIEGRVERGQRVLIVEDLVSTGGSVLSAADALRQAGAEPVAALAVFTYGFPEADRAFADAGLPLHTLTNFPTLVSAAREEDALDDGALALLESWRDDPVGWSERVAR
jgi:orotate phosphoribosyltransferase